LLASLQFPQLTITAIAESIVHDRGLYGTDSTYVVGIFRGLELALTDSDGAAIRREIEAQVARLEGGGATTTVTPVAQAPAATPSVPTEESHEESSESLSENTWVRGAVKWFNNDKGYGFISTAADADVFVHWRDISSWDRSLAQGDEVEFMVTKTAKGFQAINVMKPGAGGEQPAEGVQDEPKNTESGSTEATSGSQISQPEQEEPAVELPEEAEPPHPSTDASQNV
jgi:CspA family cold shock protein